jgi:thioredoxin-related protein
MKKLLFLFSFSLLTISITAQQKAMAAKEILEAAYKTATAENKNILLVFHASWCGWCHKMDSSLNDPSCKKFFTDNYVIIHLTVNESAEKKQLENAGADDLLKKYKAQDTGIPFWVVLDKKGNLLHDSFIKNAGGSNTIIGCPATEKEVDVFIKILKKSSSLTDKELAIIYSVFRKNESD